MNDIVEQTLRDWLAPRQSAAPVRLITYGQDGLLPGVDLDDSAATGNSAPDAYPVALAIESDSDWITTDRGFARYPGLRWRNPLPPI